MPGSAGRAAGPLTPAQARRIALAASGFSARAHRPASQERIVGVVERLGVVQIDSVNVLTRAHYLPVYSRLGPYDRTRLDGAASESPRSLFEYWGHEASLLPVSAHALLRWRMARVSDDAWGSMVRVQRENPGLVDEVADTVRSAGPLTITQLEGVLAHDHPRERGGWGWNWSLVKRAVEYLFWAGEITSAGRDGSFRRRYAAPEAVLPAAVLASPTPSPEAARRELVARAASALGVATAADLADYFRLPISQARLAIAELVSEQALTEVQVAGWTAPAYLWPAAREPRRVRASALLAPFDPLIWFRPRVARLFGMEYRIEIYTPAPRRRFGYYVLPFLFDEQLVARVDLKADRASGRLLVQAGHPEPVMPAGAIPALAQELRELAGWLGLAEVTVVAGSPLSAALSQAMPGAVAAPV